MVLLCHNVHSETSELLKETHKCDYMPFRDLNVRRGQRQQQMLQALPSLHPSVYMRPRKPTRQADLLPQHSGVQVCDVARVPSKRSLGVQSEGDGDRYVDGTRIVQ